MGGPVPHDELGRHADARERGRLEAADVEGCVGRALKMDIEIDQRRGDVFHRRLALVEVARRHKPAQLILRNRLAAAVVTGEAAQDFRPLQPMLVELRRQLRPIQEHAGPGDERKRHIGEKSMQRVPKFVEQRLGVVEGKQRRLACARLGEVHDVDDQRTDIAPKLFLVAQRRHPGAAVLRRAGEIIAEEKPAMASGLVAYLPHPHVRMPDRHVVAGFESEAEQTVRGIERSLDDPA